MRPFSCVRFLAFSLILGGLASIAVAPATAGGHIAVANRNAGNVSVIDVETDRVVASSIASCRLFPVKAGRARLRKPEGLHSTHHVATPQLPSPFRSRT